MVVEVPNLGPLDEEQQRLVQGFRKVTTAQIVDSMEVMGLPDFTRAVTIGLWPLDRSLPVMAGVAVTQLEGPRRVGTKRSHLTQHAEVMRGMKPGHVMVTAAGGLVSSCNWGGLLNLEGMRRGMVGAVVDGAVRDVELLLRTKIPIFCKGAQPLACHYVMDTLSIQQPIVCAGVHVCPGDYVIGDADGVVFVPPELAEEVLRLALEKAVIEAAREKALWEIPLERLDEDVVNNPELQLPR
jgi:regulator of RNase E activity RraA